MGSLLNYITMSILLSDLVGLNLLGKGTLISSGV